MQRTGSPFDLEEAKRITAITHNEDIEVIETL
jgi:hypothetical protein